MKRTEAETARREEFERVPAPVFGVDASHVVHIVAGPGAVDPAQAFCGAWVGADWTASEMNRWSSDWTLCQSCGDWAAELDHLTTLQQR